MTCVIEPHQGQTARVLVVDDHCRARQSMADVLTGAGHTVECRASAVEALRLLDQESFDVILTDLKMPGMTGLELIRALHERDAETNIVMITAHATVASAVDAMRFGAFDYLEKPCNAAQLEDIVARALSRGRGSSIGNAIAPAPEGRPEVVMIGSSAAMVALRERMARVAATDETVLITGENGTGKELVAQSLHAASDRSAETLVSLNCPALSSHLMESELFGHERGAFTSADAPRIGRFELADEGTILLDEVTEIDLPLQAKLLRVLQEKTYERVGSSETRHVDVRVLATTNRDLSKLVALKEFREDLYFRLAVVPLTVPPLRERRDDLPSLISHFLNETAVRMRRDPIELDASAHDLLINYGWPGNVRELKNLMIRTSVLVPGSVAGADDLRGWLMASEGEDLSLENQLAAPVGTRLADMEQRLIEATLDHFAGHRAQTAEALGIGVRTLSNKLRGYGYAPRAKVFAKAA